MRKSAGRHGKKYIGLVILAIVLYIVLGAMDYQRNREKILGIGSFN